MTRLQTPKYLAKRGEIYYFRLAIPTALRPRFGCKEVKVSLRTHDWQLARLRCRTLSNNFERFFMAVAGMSELTQDKLQEIARSYFRDLLIEGNDRIFWIEDMWGNDADERAEAIAHTQNREARLREMNQQGSAAELFTGAVKKKLDEKGLETISPGSDSYGILADYFVRAQIESSRILQAKLKKDYPAITPVDPLYAGIMDDTLPPLPEHGLGAPDTAQPLSVLVKKFKDSRQKTWEYKSQLDFERVLGWFVECLGANKPVKSIVTTDIGNFRDVLLKIPKNYTQGKGKSGLTLKEAMATMVDSPTLAPQTAEKYLNMTRTFLYWCESEGAIDKVPGQKITIEYKVTEKPRLPFTNDQMIALFISPVWTGSFSRSRRSRPGSLIMRNAYYWIPLVAAYTGMRCGEIVQLRHMDILTFEDIQYIDVNDDHQKKLKTKYSRRRIPIHPKLKEWGFMEFIAGRYHGNGQGRIFNEIAISKKGDPSHAYSKVFSRYLTDIGIKNDQLTFHSFRHTFSDALDNASVVEAAKKAMMGHSDGSASAQYGVGSAIPVLFEAISKISYSFEASFDPAPISCKIITEKAA